MPSWWQRCFKLSPHRLCYYAAGGTELTKQDSNQELKECIACGLLIPWKAQLCHNCNSYQDRRRWLSTSTTTLALLTAFVSVVGLVFPTIVGMFHTPQSKAHFSSFTVDGTSVRAVVTNSGDAPATFARAWTDGKVLAPATKIRLRGDDSSELLAPGSTVLKFEIVPLLTEEQSYTLAMQGLKDGLKGIDKTKSVLNFALIQSDGTQTISAYEITGNDLFLILRANSDRCSAIEDKNHENGCIGSGSPDDFVSEMVLGKKPKL